MIIPYAKQNTKPKILLILADFSYFREIILAEKIQIDRMNTNLNLEAFEVVRTLCPSRLQVASLITPGFCPCRVPTPFTGENGVKCSKDKIEHHDFDLQDIFYF